MMKGSHEVRFGTHIAGNGFKGGGGAVQYLKGALGGGVYSRQAGAGDAQHAWWLAVGGAGQWMGLIQRLHAGSCLQGQGQSGCVGGWAVWVGIWGGVSGGTDARLLLV